LDVSSYLVCLSVKDEQELQTLLDKATERNIRVVEFREPDFNNQLTSICLEPTIETKKLCSSIPLAFKEKSDTIKK
jgi:hypothetical protein